MKYIFTPIITIFCFCFVLGQEDELGFCLANPPQCYVCDAEEIKDLEVIGFGEINHVINRIIVKVNPNLLGNIEPDNQTFNNEVVDDLSDIYGLTEIQAIGETDYYILIFRNFKNLQCVIDGYEGLVDEVTQSPYFYNFTPIGTRKGFEIDTTILNKIKNSENRNNNQKDEKQLISSDLKIGDPIFIKPKASRYSEQWHIPKIDLERAWAITQGNSKVNVIIFDDFFSYYYPRNYGRNRFPFFSSSTSFYRLPNQNTFLYNNIGYSHGDSILNVYGNEGITNSNLDTVGVDGNSKITLISSGSFEYFFDEKKGIVRDSVFPDDIQATAFDTYSNSNIITDYKVLNASFGSNVGVKATISLFNELAISKFLDSRPNCLIVAAADNVHEEYKSENVFWLGVDDIKDNLLIVSGTNENDDNTEYAYGDVIDVVAPASKIFTETSTYKNEEVIESLTISSGTSYATPIVSGIASLIYSLEHSSGANKQFGALEVKNMIITTAEKYKFTSAIENEYGIILYPKARDEKLARGRVNAHQAILLSSAHLNHYIGDNSHILRSTENIDPKVFSLPFDKVLFDNNSESRKYALMLNRHKFSMYKLPEDGEAGNLIWESKVTIPNEVDFEGFYAKELRLEGEKLELLTIDGQTSWEVNIPIVEYPKLGNRSTDFQCIPKNSYTSLERICTRRIIRDTHQNLGIDNGHMIAQWIEINSEGHMLVKRKYINTGGEILIVTAWSSHGGHVNTFDSVHRHLISEEHIYSLHENINYLLINDILRENQYLEALNGSFMTINEGDYLIQLEKKVDTNLGEHWVEKSKYQLN